MNPEQVLSALNWRYAVKVFDPARKISPLEWGVLEESLRLTPSSYGLQPWKFIPVENPETRARLRQASWNQSQVTDASHYLVIASKEKITAEDVARFIQSTANARGVPMENLSGYANLISGDLVHGPRSGKIEAWSQRQCYIAMGFSLLAAANLGIDTCAMEGIDPGAYDSILGLSGSGYRTLAGIAFGYRADSDKYANAQKVRYSAEEVFIRGF
jgi:nitroreductase